MYASEVSSGISPLEPRWAILYGRKVCKGCLLPRLYLLGSGYKGLPKDPATSKRNTKEKMPVMKSKKQGTN